MMYKTVVGNCALECDSKFVFQPGPKSSLGSEPSQAWPLQMPSVSMPRVEPSEQHQAALPLLWGLAPLFPPWGHLMSPILKECIWLNWVPVAKIPKIGTIISVGLQGDENKLTRMKSAQKISHTENNYTMFSETKGPCIITRNNLMDLAISAAVPASIFSYESDKSILFWKIITF